MSERPDGRYTLRVLGTPDLTAPDGRRVASVLSQPKRLALLTYLAMSPGPVSRANVIATFWPDSDDARARNALSQALFHLRRALGEDVVVSLEGDRLGVSAGRLRCDARDVLEGLVEPGEAELLEGWQADDAPPLQAWLDAQRRRMREMARPVASALDPTTVASTNSRRPRWGVAATLAVTIAAIVIAVPRLSGRPASQELAVLMPRVTLAADAPTVEAQLILDEVLAHLPHVEGLAIVPAASASSVPAFRTQLATIGTPPESAPDFILETSVRVAAGRIAVVALLYRSPAMDVPGRVSFDVTQTPDGALLLESPRDIARGIAAMVERVLASP